MGALSKIAVVTTGMALMNGVDLAVTLSGTGVSLAQDVLRGMTMLKLKMNAAVWTCILTLGCVAAAFGALWL